jgi:hypothetical protein
MNQMMTQQMLREQREWQSGQDEKAERRFRMQIGQGRWQILIVGVLATIALAAAQIIGSLIQAGRLFQPPPNLPTQQAPAVPQAQPR